MVMPMDRAHSPRSVSLAPSAAVLALLCVVSFASVLRADEHSPSTIGPTPASEIESGRPTDARAGVVAHIARMRQGVKTTSSSRCTFHQTEWVGSMLPPSKIELKSRKNGDVYMRWLEGPVAGREVLYRKSTYDGKLLVKHGIFPAITVDPKGYLARQGNRHTVLEAGLVRVSERILEDADLLERLPKETAVFTDLGRKVQFGQQVACWRTEVDKDRYPALYAHKTEICADVTTGLPVTIRAWAREDGAIRLVEDYAFVSCQLNTLTDTDFDEKNPAYSY
jgi:hypothetical protein